MQSIFHNTVNKTRYLEDGQSGDGVNGRNETAESKALHYTQLIHESSDTQNVHTCSDDHGRDSSAKYGKGENGADVLEEVSFVQGVAGLEDDRRQEEQEKHGGVKGLCILKQRHYSYKRRERTELQFKQN